MAQSSDRFPASIVGVLAKRAANICSNPDCGALTSGPARDPTRSLNVGEAAHIHGAKPGSARFRSDMNPSERSNLTNAIWLCRNCHKLVDGDTVAFGAPLLFEWRREHERVIGDRVGKTSQAIRDRLNEQALAPFRKSSYLAQQIVLDKPDHWEYRLTAEVLRDLLHPIVVKWRALDAGLYAVRGERVTADTFATWQSENLTDLSRQTTALNGLLNGEIQRTWGPPGEPGSETEILRVCELIAAATHRMLDWEERIKFAFLPEVFQPVQNLFLGVAGRQIEKIFSIPKQTAAIFEEENPTGTRVISVEFDLPDGWNDQLEAALEQAIKAHFSEDPF